MISSCDPGDSWLDYKYHAERTKEGICPPDPCPRCKEKAHLVYLGLNYGYVECVPCSIRTEDAQMDKAISAWNSGEVKEV